MTSYSKFLCLLILSAICGMATAQTVLNESFDSTAFVPAGWYKAKIAPATFPNSGQWQRLTSATYPNAVPHSGAGMAGLLTASLANETVSELGTRRLDFSSGARYRVRFWVYRVVYSLYRNDLLEVYINTQPNTQGAARLDSIEIPWIKTITETGDGWYEYAYEIPPTYNTDSNYLIFRASQPGGNSIFIDDVIVESFQCHQPPAAIIGNITNTSATAFWTSPSAGIPTGYEWEVRTQGSPGSSDSGLSARGSTAASITSVTANGLTPGTNCKFYVRGVCGIEKSVWSMASTFKTPYDPFTVPFAENFDGVRVGLPPCTAIENADGGETWQSSFPIFSSPSRAHRSAPNGLYCVGRTTIQNDWFFLPKMRLEAGKCYKISYAGKLDYYQYTASVKIALGTEQNAQSMTLGEISNNTFSTDTFRIISQTFSVPSQDNYVIGINLYATTPSTSVYLEDITVTEAIGVPSSIAATSIGATAAQFGWTSPTCGVASLYEWEARTAGAAGSGASGLVATDSSSDLSAAVNGLIENKQYTFYVRAKNGQLVSQWSAGVIFRTSCNTRTLPYIERFDNIGTALPACILKQDVAVPYNRWNTWLNVAYEKPYSGSNCMRFGTNNSTVAGDNWFFTPPFNFAAGVSYRLSFYYQSDLSYRSEKLEVKFGTGPNVAAMNATPIFINTNITNSLYMKATVDFVPNQAGVYNIGFHGFSDALRQFIYVDDIEVSETPACDLPKDLKAFNLTSTTGLLKWNLPQASSPTGYNWELRTTGTGGSGATGLASSGQLGANELSVSLAGMNAATKYTFYIRGNCGAQNSAWASYSFATACEAQTVPYVENFDGVASPNYPSCTSIEENIDRYQWNNTTGYARSAPNSLYHASNWQSAFDDWFFAAPLQLVAGRSYKLRFYYRNEVSGYTDGVEVKIGRFAQGDSMNTPAIYSNLTVSSSSYQMANATFTVPESGVYVLGFRSIPSSYSRGISIDDISVNEENPDLKINRLVLSDSAAFTSGSITASFSITNQGLLNAAANNVHFYLSPNNLLTPGTNGDTLIASYPIVSSIDAGVTTATLSQTISIPCTIPPGNYYLYCVADADNTIFEINENNNSLAATMVVKKGAYWNGSISTAWETAGNWSCNKVPDETTEVFINSGEVILHSTTTIKSLKLKTSASLTVVPGIILNLLN